MNILCLLLLIFIAACLLPRAAYFPLSCTCLFGKGRPGALAAPPVSAPCCCSPLPPLIAIATATAGAAASTAATNTKCRLAQQ